jgi:hypothetical protein
MNKLKALFTILFVLWMSACSAIQPIQSNIDLEIDCTNPRPTICTLEVKPVCGNRFNGIQCKKAPCPDTDKVDFSNRCEACTDIAVDSFKLGVCK